MRKYKYILNLMEFLAHDFGDISFAECWKTSYTFNQSNDFWWELHFTGVSTQSSSPTVWFIIEFLLLISNHSHYCNLGICLKW